MACRTRFAPSPTGSIHIGGIRTALFSYLWAKHNNGQFLLRIEDTDRERLVEGATKEIEEALRWLGLNYDEEVIFQSERRKVHYKYAQKLIDIGVAYKCFCTKERLEKLRQDQENKKIPTGYDRHCRNLTKEEIAKYEEQNKPFVIRLAMPTQGKAEWDDAIRGKMSIDYALSDDQILVKSNGWPTYFLASVVDDHESKITDVIRGEEWLPSTPKIIFLYQSFGWQIPRLAHMPVIVGPSGKKLSKRDGDTAALDYRKKGYLPEALINFLVLLGWNPKTNQEFFEINELIKLFDLKDINKAPTIFDIKKLDWMNGHYIRKLDNKRLTEEIKNLLPNLKLLKLANWEKIIEVEKTRLVRLIDIDQNTDFYLNSPKINEKELIFKKSTKESTRKGLETSFETLSKISDWGNLKVEDFNNVLSKIVGDNNLSNGDVFWPVRYALSGLEKSPSPGELLWVLGKEESLKRIKTAIKLLGSNV